MGLQFQLPNGNGLSKGSHSNCQHQTFAIAFSESVGMRRRGCQPFFKVKKMLPRSCWVKNKLPWRKLPAGFVQPCDESKIGCGKNQSSTQLRGLMYPDTIFGGKNPYTCVKCFITFEKLGFMDRMFANVHPISMYIYISNFWIFITLTCTTQTSCINFTYL